MSTWGPVRTIVGLRRQTIAVLQRWLPAALEEVSRQEDYDLPEAARAVRTWRVLTDPRDAVDDQLPALFVTSAGLAADPLKDGDGKYSVIWALTATVVVRGQDHQQTADVVGIYTAAVRVVLAQNPSLDGYAAGSWWQREDYDALDIGKSGARTLGAGFVDFDVAVKDVVDATGRPSTPPDSEWPVIEKTNADVTNTPANEEL